MKTLFNVRLFSLVGILFLINACTADNQYNLVESSPALTEFEEDLDGAIHDHSSHAAVGYEAEISAHVDGQELILKGAEEIDFFFPDGTSEKRYRIEDDIVITEEEYNTLSSLTSDIEMRQYRTFNLVNNNQTITVIGYTGGGGYGLSSKMRTALSWAINNYNALNTGLTFSLSYAASVNAEIVVYRVPNGQAGGQAGFPSGGNPYKWVQIFSGMDAYNTNVVEHVITHEIGHSMGLRHTDYFSRVSCGQNVNEGSAGVGAVHIPGTPTGVDWNSVMLACFSSSEDGEFGFYDRVALEYLY